MKVHDLSGLAKLFKKNKYVLTVAVLALLLIFLPSGRSGGSSPSGGLGSQLQSSGIPVDTESARLSAFIAQIEGVGDVSVLLSGEGAVVICQGAENTSVRLDVTNAVSAYTGLGSDKIRIIKMK